MPVKTGIQIFAIRMDSRLRGNDTEKETNEVFGERMGILSLLTFFPLIGVVALLIMRKASDNALKWVAISTAIATFALSLVVLGQFDTGVAGLQPPYAGAVLLD